jgi:large subunit ribosomal protein L21
MTYAIIRLGGKQYRVADGEKLLVDRLSEDVGKSVTPDILLVGGNGDPELAPKGVTVKAHIVEHVLGQKVRIGKYKPKSGYRRHAGHRSRLSRVEIELVGKQPARPARAKPASETAAEKPKRAAKPKQAAEPAPAAKPRATAQPKAAPKPRAAAKPKEGLKVPKVKPAAKKKEEE